MNHSIVKALATVSDALAAVVESDELAPVAARATAEAVGCRTATVWLLTEGTGPGWLSRLKEIPGMEQLGRRFLKNGSSPEGTRLRLAGTNGHGARAWPQPATWLRARLGTAHMTLDGLTDGQVTTAAELAAAPSQAVQIGEPGTDGEVRLAVGLFCANASIGLVECTWDQESQSEVNGHHRDLLVTLANYLGQVFGDFGSDRHRDEPTLSPDTDLFLAGTGLLLTALDVGSTSTRECAEAVTRSALEMAAEKQLSAAEAQTLQWAALFHEVGQAPMDRWLTFSAPDEAGDSAPDEAGSVDSDEPEQASERDDSPFDELRTQPSLSLIPHLEPAASLLAEVAPVLDGQDGNPDSDISLPATLLAAACRSSGHCETLPSAQPDVGGVVREPDPAEAGPVNSNR